MPSDWIVIQPSLEPITDKIEPIITPVVSVIDVLIKVLNISSAVLEIAKAFLVGVLDPLKPLLEQTIKEIQAIISDLRQLGFYLHGDWNLFDPSNNFSDLLGGYPEYETRMLGRLLDTTDQNRPNFSPQSTTLGLFLYASTGDIAFLLDSINKILEFFGKGDQIGTASPYSIPQQPQIRYSSLNVLGIPTYVSLDQLEEKPEKISISWETPQNAGIPFTSAPAPKSYIIHVSTIPDGFGLLAIQPKDDTSQEIESLPVVSGTVIDPVTNKPLRLYGGASDIEIFEYPDDPRSPKLVLTLDPQSPFVKPKDLLQNGDHIFGKSFKVGTGFFDKLAPGAAITALLDVSELPKTADIVNSGGYAKLENIRDSEVYYIRVRACGIETTAKLKEPEENDIVKYFVNSNMIRTIRSGALVASFSGRGSAQVLSKCSKPAEVKLPSDKTLDYQSAVQTAIAVMLLCRVNLSESKYFAKDVIKEGYLTGLETMGRKLLQKYNVSDSIFRGKNPVNFRRKIRGIANIIQAHLQETCAIPDEVIVSLEEDINLLNQKSFGGDFFEESVSLLEALGDNNRKQGIGANPFCRDIGKKVLKDLYLGGISQGPTRNPSFYISGSSPFNAWIDGMGSADTSPILYNDTDLDSEPVYIRNWFWEEKEENGSTSFLELSRKILGVASVTPNIADDGWIPVRFLSTAVPQADEILEKVEVFLEGVLESLESLADKIESIIESIQAKIYQLQGLLEYIKSLLESLTSFAFPPIAGLVLVENGTAGLAGGLVSSGNKPGGSPIDYSAGVAVVAGGVPTILLDILFAIFSGGEE